MKLIKYPSIEQYRNVISTVKKRSTYHNVLNPKIKFLGTIKSHGTNASVCQYVDPNSEFDTWAQSRSNIITTQNDNYGFAAFVESNKEYFENIFDSSRDYVLKNNIATNDDIISIFGEWCGQGIQKNIAISHCPKMFIIFDIIVAKSDDNYIWLKKNDIQNIFNETLKNEKIKLIFNFKTWEIEIDFNHPELSQNALSEITSIVEQQCPIGLTQGVYGKNNQIIKLINDEVVSDSFIDYELKDKVTKILKNLKTEKNPSPSIQLYWD